MADDVVDVLATSDARVWADEFVKTFARSANNDKPGYLRGLAEVWFANAMMNGFDRGVAQVNAMSVVQPWALQLSKMQQTVLIEIVRGPDGLTKYHKSKFLLRWYRRCLLISAFDKKVLTHPAIAGGGSFTGPAYDEGVPEDQLFKLTRRWEVPMLDLLNEVIRGADEMPHHFYRHMMHGFEIMGYKHPDDRIRQFWNLCYTRLAKDMHLTPETEAELDVRLGDTREGWLKSADEATLA